MDPALPHMSELVVWKTGVTQILTLHTPTNICGMIDLCKTSYKKLHEKINTLKFTKAGGVYTVAPT